MTVVLWIRVAVGLLFLAAGAAKLFGRSEFEVALRDYRAMTKVPMRGIRALAVVVPVLECIVGVGMVLPIGPLWIPAIAVLVMLVGFTTAVWLNAREGIESACGCGVGGGKTGYALVVRNSLLIVAVALSAVISPESTLGRARESVGSAIAVYLAAAVLAALLTFTPPLVEEFRHQLTHVRT